ncbi:MAG TPA: HAD family phosphatase [Candidatus Babeliales bacterium]|nr:HAD family phosphatase [Candidatus Babeliales bacterium]
MKGQRERPFAVFDIDGTLIRWQLYHAVADALVKLGYVEPGSYDSIKSARMSWKTRLPGINFRTYELEVIRVYEEVLNHLPATELDAAVETVFGEYKDQVYTYTRDLIQRLKNEHYILLAISGSQIEVVKLVAAHYGFDDFIGTVYERKDNRFTGNKSVPAFDKAKVLRELVDKHNLIFDDSIGIGDSLSDAAMLELVQQPIAFNPDKSLFDRANQSGWKIVIERKNMIYELNQKDGKYELVKTD